jgi:hypothetical protein
MQHGRGQPQQALTMLAQQLERRRRRQPDGDPADATPQDGQLQATSSSDDDDDDDAPLL